MCLASLVLSSLAWLWSAQWWVLNLTKEAPANAIYQVHLPALAVWCGMLSLVLATALRGTPRLQAIGAAVLLVVACQSIAYV